MKVHTAVHQAHLRAPFVFTRESVTMRPLILLRIEARDGVVGFGEAAPLPAYDGVTVDDVLAALDDCRPLLTASDGLELTQLRAACERTAALPQATAAIDLALWDLEGRRADAPVWRLLGTGTSPVNVNATIAAPDRAGAAAEAGAAAAAGFGCVKVKVGIGDEAGRLAAVRAAAGPLMEIRLDANGAWSVSEAVATLGMLEPVGIELCEEPARGLHAVAAVCEQTLVPIAIDESASAPGALDRRACDAVCLKISRCGGISGLLAAAGRARATGYEVYIASTLDGPLGIAAALHAAAAVRPDRHCGLATLGRFSGRDNPLPAVRGTIALPRGPGLGDGLARWYSGAAAP